MKAKGFYGHLGLFATMTFMMAFMVIPSLSWAEDGDSGLTSSYSFGGACGSQGTWTQNALSSTQALRKITLKLKNDANCTSLGSNLEAALAKLENNIEASDNDKRATRLSQIPEELSALRNFAASSPSQKKDVLNKTNKKNYN
jgi:hypothetical protein